MKDPIERQAALDEIRTCTEVYVNNLPPMIDKAEVQTKIMLMPSAEPERKKGER